MNDSWENDDFIIPVLSVRSKEQLERLEERKLVEQSDNELSKNLFENDNNVSIIDKESNKINENQIKTNIIRVSKQKENEDRIKEYTKRLKQIKEEREKEKEIFGNCEIDDNYLELEDKFS